MAAVELRSRGVADPDIALVTPEPRPLEVFGEAAGDAVASLLSERGVRLLAGRRPTELAGRELRTAQGESIPADRVIALAESVGPYVPGLPHDPLGFLPTDAHMRVRGVPGVYAAGDSTTFPLRQGGLAAQQADAAAEAIAVELGATATARPFRPV